MDNIKISKGALIYFFIYFTICLILYIFFIDENIGDFFVTSFDEYRYYSFSNYLINDVENFGWYYVFNNYYQYSQSLHFGHYIYLSFFRMISNDSLSLWYISQTTIFFLANLFFSKFICLEFNVSKNKSYFIAISMIFYLPLFYLTYSLMRDISIFFLISGSLFFYKKENFYISIFFLAILITYRMNACLGVIAYIFCDLLIKKKLNLKNLIFCFLAFFSAGIYMFENYLDTFIRRVVSLDYTAIFLESIRFIFSPIPWQIDANIPMYLYAWYHFSFFICLISILITISILMTKKNKSFFSIPIIIMIFFNIIAYSTEIGVGFRQMAVLSPFFYIPIFIFLIKVSKLK